MEAVQRQNSFLLILIVNADRTNSSARVSFVVVVVVIVASVFVFCLSILHKISHLQIKVITVSGSV